MAQIEGKCEPRFEAVRGALAQYLDSGEELGASLVVDIDGDLVVDMWGGFCDQAPTLRFRRSSGSSPRSEPLPGPDRPEPLPGPDRAEPLPGAAAVTGSRRGPGCGVPCGPASRRW